MFGLNIGFGAVAAISGVVLSGIVVGALLISKSSKEAHQKERSNDATPLQTCWEQAKTQKEKDLCFHKNKDGSLRKQEGKK